jgi:hypothetical protein
VELVVENDEILLTFFRIGFPCHCINTRSRPSLECEEGGSENVNAYMMQQRCQLFLPVSVYCFSYAGLRL